MYLNWPLLLPKPVKKGSEMDPSVNRKGCQQRVPPQPKCQKQFLILPFPETYLNGISQKAPKVIQDLFKSRLRPPKEAQEPPKGRPGGSQTRPKSSPGTYSKRFLLQVLLAGLAEQSEIDFLIMLRCCAKAPKAIFLHTRGVL